MRARAWRILAVLSAIAGYSAVAGLVPRESLFQAMILAAVPVLLAAMAFGLPGALWGTGGIAATNLLMIIVIRGVPVAEVLQSGVPAGVGVTLVVGALIGQLRTISRRLERERRQLLQTQQVTIFALAYQAELRDFATGQHLERTAKYVEILARELAKLPRYRGYLTKEYIRDLVRAAPLHDIGKVGIPDAVLLKPGKLSPSEYAIIQEHCDLGVRVLTKAHQRLEFQSFLAIAIQITGTHHEKWNGSGYPRNAKAAEIPLSGRIMALADVYDAMRTERVYKPAFPREQALGRILMDRGAHFDPEIVDCFVRVEHRFALVAEAMADFDEDAASLEELIGG
jgi:HD-GYP domain-containing protein (c-di-GMP phosphodiesterase class II)